MKKILFGVLASLLLTSVGFADQEAGSRTYVKAGEYGQFYIKSIPSESYGLEGKSQVFRVKDEQDELLYTYDWFSPEIYIYGFATGDPIYVVKMGPWYRNHEANEKDLGIAFYKNDKLLREYSTLDIVKDKNNVQASVSHYTIFEKRIGFRRPWGNQIMFDVQTHDGNILSFNVETGDLITKENEAEKKAFLKS